MGDGKINGNLLVLRRAMRGVVGLSEGGAGKSIVVVVRDDDVKVGEIGELGMWGGNWMVTQDHLSDAAGTEA